MLKLKLVFAYMMKSFGLNKCIDEKNICYSNLSLKLNSLFISNKIGPSYCLILAIGSFEHYSLI